MNNCSRRSRDFEFCARSSLPFFCLAGSRDKSRLVLPPTPLHDISGAFPRALYYCFYVPLPPLIVRPIEFRLVFASLALVALEAGQSCRSYFCLNSSTSLLPRAEFCIRGILFASRI
jgi:hypothetical protein